ncbi:MAG: hypothetical protein ACTS73_05610 [Arsenophonus sp. NEOnobi-MAG3]
MTKVMTVLFISTFPGNNISADYWYFLLCNSILQLIVYSNTTMMIYSFSLVAFSLLHTPPAFSTQHKTFIAVFVFMMPAVLLLSGYVFRYIEDMSVLL